MKRIQENDGTYTYMDLDGRRHQNSSEAHSSDIFISKERWEHDRAYRDAASAKHDEFLEKNNLTKLDIWFSIPVFLFTLAFIGSVSVAIESSWRGNWPIIVPTHFILICASWYVWYLIMKMPVGIRIFIQFFLIMMPLFTALYMGWL